MTNELNNKISVKLKRMEMKKYKNKEAKVLIASILAKPNELNQSAINYVNQWLTDRQVLCYVLSEDQVIKGMVLLSKMDWDPYGTQLRPYMLNFVYTWQSYRRLGLACQMLRQIEETVTACCCTDASEKCFEKAGYKCHGFDTIMGVNPMYRSP